MPSFSYLIVIVIDHEVLVSAFLVASWIASLALQFLAVRILVRAITLYDRTTNYYQAEYLNLPVRLYLRFHPHS